MSKVKTSELIGSALDWAVAYAIGEYKPVAVPNYSTDWAQGGPIIEREHINLRPTFTTGGYRTSQSMDAVNAKIDLPNGATIFDPENVVQEYGETSLIAAMRCYVASKLGEFVDVPEELL